MIVTVLVASLAFATPREIAFSRLLPAAPALAASLWPVLPTVLLGAFCLLVMIGLSFVYSDLGTQYTSAAIVAVTLAAAYASHLRLQREEAFLQLRLVAGAAQKVLLRPLPPRIQDVEIESLYLAAQEQARVGGDFYEAADTPYGVRLLIGDVRGKGLSAVGAASALISSFRENAHDQPDLRGIAHRLQVAMARYSAAIPAVDQPEYFATALIAEIPYGSGHVRIINCGHPPPVFVRNGEIHVLEPTLASTPLNLAALLGEHAGHPPAPGRRVAGDHPHRSPAARPAPATALARPVQQCSGARCGSGGSCSSVDTHHAERRGSPRRGRLAIIRNPDT